jgi:superoxide dismutase
MPKRTPTNSTTNEIYKYLEKEGARIQHEQHMRALVSNLVRELAHEKSYSHQHVQKGSPCSECTG